MRDSQHLVGFRSRFRGGLGWAFWGGASFPLVSVSINDILVLQRCFYIRGGRFDSSKNAY
jgi:hypothetical protein